MIANTNSGDAAAPRLHCYMNLMALEALPAFSAGPQTAEMEPRLRAIQQAGYDGVQLLRLSPPRTSPFANGSVWGVPAWGE